MTSTAAWCVVKDMLAEAPSAERNSEAALPFSLRLKERIEFLEEKLREQVEKVLVIEEEVGEWRGLRPEGESPEELGAYLAAQEDEKDGLEKERDDARSERDSARYVVESAAYYLARGDVAGAMAVLQEDVASRKYSAGSQAQDSLKGLAAQLGDKREWRRVGRRPSEGNGGAR